MNRFLALFFILFATLAFTPELYAQTKRTVDLEFEEVDGATEYEIELTSKRTSKTLNFKMKEARWQATVRTGDYIMRMRSYDKRGVPGGWSEKTLITIKLPGPNLLEPKMDEEIKTGKPKTFKTTLRWEEISGAKYYRVEITPEAGDPIIEEPKESSVVVELPVAMTYTWKVTPFVDNEEGESRDPHQFTLIGAPLEKPEIEKPYDVFITDMKWEKPEHTQTFNYVLAHQELDGSWKKLDVVKDYKSNSIAMPIEYPGGKYKLSVKAFGHKRETSPAASLEFDVYSGNRAPAAIEEAKLRASLDKPTPYYFIASYFITQVNFVSQYSNSSSTEYRQTAYNALGGTGRLGLGYINPKNNLGGLGIIDLSGMTIKNKDGSTTTETYASAEGHATWRYTWGRNMLRVSTGLFYKELVESTDVNNADLKYENQKIAYLGPHVGFDLWRPFTSKFGMQLNTRFYYGYMGMETPSGGDINPQISYQYGFMGSYKLRPNITGFAGYAYRMDHANYNAQKPAPGAPSTQDVKIDGSYLNLLLEWGF